jgi:hypothetical protein
MPPCCSRRQSDHHANATMHDRRCCTALAFTHSCSCDVGHTRHSVKPIASCILIAWHKDFLQRTMNRHHQPSLGSSASAPSQVRTRQRAEMPRTYPRRARKIRFENERCAPQAAASSPSCPSLLGRHGENEQAGGGARSARGRRPFPVTPSRASTSTPRRRSRVVELSSAVTGPQHLRIGLD